MMNRQKLLGFCFWFTLFPTALLADSFIHVPFDGLTDLLSNAEVLVVARVVEVPRLLSAGREGIYLIRVVQVIKGSLAKDSKVIRAGEPKGANYSTNQLWRVSLRVAPFLVVGSSQPVGSLIDGAFHPDEQYVLFLRRSSTSEPAQFVGAKPGCDAIWIPQNADLKQVVGLSPREAVQFLLNVALKAKQSRLHEFENAMGHILEKK